MEVYCVIVYIISIRVIQHNYYTEINITALVSQDCLQKRNHLNYLLYLFHIKIQVVFPTKHCYQVNLPTSPTSIKALTASRFFFLIVFGRNSS